MLIVLEMIGWVHLSGWRNQRINGRKWTLRFWPVISGLRHCKMRSQSIGKGSRIFCSFEITLGKESMRRNIICWWGFSREMHNNQKLRSGPFFWYMSTRKKRISKDIANQFLWEKNTSSISAVVVTESTNFSKSASTDSTQKGDLSVDSSHKYSWASEITRKRRTKLWA